MEKQAYELTADITGLEVNVFRNTPFNIDDNLYPAGKVLRRYRLHNSATFKKETVQELDCACADNNMNGKKQYTKISK